MNADTAIEATDATSARISGSEYGNTGAYLPINHKFTETITMQHSTVLIGAAKIPTPGTAHKMYKVTVLSKQPKNVATIGIEG